MTDAPRPDALVLEGIDLETQILIIGGGALGSAIEGGLTIMSFPNVAVLDFDEWEYKNTINNLWPSPPGTPKASHEQFKMDIESYVEDYPEKWDVIITATDSISSRMVAFTRMKPSLGFLDVRTGLMTGTIVRGDAQFMIDNLPKDDETENYECGQIGSIAHSMTIGGFALLRLIEGLKNKWTNQYSQVGFSGLEPTLLLLKGETARNAQGRDSTRSSSTRNPSSSDATNAESPARNASAADTPTGDPMREEKSAMSASELEAFWQTKYPHLSMPELEASLQADDAFQELERLEELRQIGLKNNWTK